MNDSLGREIELLRADITAILNRRYGTKHVRYDVDLMRKMGLEQFDAYVALMQLAEEFPGEIDMDRARREPAVYLRVLDRLTSVAMAKREEGLIP